MNPDTDWIRSARRLVDTLRPPAGEAALTGESHGSDCRWCPVCQAAAVVRGERPEVTAALADVLTASATALRTLAAAGEPAAPQAADAPAEKADPSPAVQQVDIA
jgi:hypothetical protein